MAEARAARAGRAVPAPRLEARIWWCQDECDCTVPGIMLVTARSVVGLSYPVYSRELIWGGEFLVNTWAYPPDEIERLQYAPLRAWCRRYAVQVPEVARAA